MKCGACGGLVSLRIERGKTVYQCALCHKVYGPSIAVETTQKPVVEIDRRKPPTKWWQRLWRRLND